MSKLTRTISGKTVLAIATSTESYLTSSPKELNRQVNGERQLIAAMIERAIADALPVTRMLQHEKRDALNWISKKLESNPRIFSFQWACQALDLDPKALKDAILEKHKRNEVFYRDKLYSNNKPLLTSNISVL